jgi:hypothetical protein
MKKLLLFIPALLLFAACKKECKTPGQGTLTFKNNTGADIHATDNNGQEIAIVGAHSTYSGNWNAGCSIVTFGNNQNYCVTECNETIVSY